MGTEISLPIRKGHRLWREPSEKRGGGGDALTIIHGDALERLRELPNASIDACVTDPPYGIRFMGKAWDGVDIVRRYVEANTDFNARAKTGMAAAAGKYDRSTDSNRAFQEWTRLWAVEVFRVLKPGAHLVCFASTRTYHRMTCGIEDAGFEIRDQLAWVFGSGFPKSRNLDGDWKGWGTALKPAWEPIALARKPLVGTVAANVAAHGTGALNIDGCRVSCGERPGVISNRRSGNNTYSDGLQGSRRTENITTGRWPANLAHDGSGEIVAYFPAEAGAAAPVRGTEPSVPAKNTYGVFKRGGGVFHGDKGSAARFFYCAKASRADRNDGLSGLPKRALNWSSGEQTSGTFQSEGTQREVENHHPTVKPTNLMRWLCRLVTPPNGTIVDPFSGSGSTGRGAAIEGFSFIGIDQDAEYCEIARARIAAIVSATKIERAQMCLSLEHEEAA